MEIFKIFRKYFREDGSLEKRKFYENIAYKITGYGKIQNWFRKIKFHENSSKLSVIFQKNFFLNFEP